MGACLDVGRRCLVVALSALWIANNAALTYFAKMMYTTFESPYPLTMFASQQLVMGMCLLPFVERTTLWTNRRSLAILGLFFSTHIVLNKESMLTIPVSLNQVVKAFVPGCIMLVGVCIERRYPTQTTEKRKPPKRIPTHALLKHAKERSWKR